MSATIIKPEEKTKSVKLDVQQEYIGLYDIEPFDIDQKLMKGKLIETSRLGRFANITDRDLIIFSNDYEPETNDMDKIFKEVHINDSLIGKEFLMVPLNKVRMFYTPESSIIKLAGKGTVQC